MTSYRSTRSGMTGLEILAIVGIAAVVLWIAKPAIDSKLQSRKIAKVEQKIEARQDGARTEDNKQLEQAHQLIVGTNAAIIAIPGDKRTPASDLAGDLSLRAISAIGAGRNTALDPVLEQAIRESVRLALSPIVEENVRGRQQISALSVQLGESTARETALRAQISDLTKQRDEAVTEKLATAARLEWLLYYGKIVLVVVAFIIWGLPLLTKFFPALAPLNRLAQWLVHQSGAAAMDTLTATVRGVDQVRQRLKSADVPETLRKEVDQILKDEIYDSHDDRVQAIRRQEKLV